MNINYKLIFLGSTNSLISYVGTHTLESIARCQRYKTIGDLLRANVDYFSYHIIIKLRQVERNSGVLDVVQTVIKYSKLDFLPYLKGIVEDVLRQLSGGTPFHKRNVYSFLKIFFTFIVSVKTLVKQQETKKQDTRVASISETIILSLLEYYNAKKLHEKIEDDMEETESMANVPNIELPEETSRNKDANFNTEGSKFIFIFISISFVYTHFVNMCFFIVC